MMEIRGPEGVGGVGGPGRIEGTRPPPPPPAAGAPGGEPDRVDISSLARLLGAANQLPQVRLDKVERLKAEIASGRYETPDKIEKMVARLMEDLGDAPEA